jgi:signal transduction histidine kinase
MTRPMLVAVAALCVSLVGIGIGTLRLVHQARADLLAQLDVAQRRQLDEVARLLHDDIEHVGSDLRLLARLGADVPMAADRREEITALVTSVREYRMAAIFDDEGRTLLSVVDPTATEAPPASFAPELLRLANEALRLPAGQTVSGPPFAVGGSWFRGFALSLPARRDGRPAVITLAVDTNTLFAKLRLLTADNASRVILLGAHGRATPATDSVLVSATDNPDPVRTPAYAELIRAMRAGERGLRHLPAADALQLGLGQAEAVAAFAPVEIDGGGHWSVATVSSTAVFDTHERTVIERVAAAALAVSMLLIGFGAYVVVTQRRAVALRERLSASEALGRAQARTQHVLDHIPTGVITCSIDACVLAVNHALADRIPASAIGASLACAFPDAPDALVRVLDALLGSARASEQPQSLFGEPAALFGEEGCYNLHAVPLDLRRSEPRLLLVIEDVSRIAALESQLLRAEKLVTVGELAAGMAHEVGTPLGVVRGRAEYVLRKLGPEHSQASGVADIVEQIDQVTRTIRQLLDFSRVSPAVVQPVSIAEALRDVRELMRFEAERHKIAIDIEAPDDLEPVSADPDQLRQVLVNLMKNALDASAPASRVVLRALRDGDDAVHSRLRIEIEDHGGGIPAASLNRIFDPFFTTKKRGHGTGLGLAITAQIVRNHGAEIRVDSEEGRGSRISVLWPTTAKEERRSHGG